MNDFPTLIELVSNPALATAIVTLIANGLAKVWSWDRRITAAVLAILLMIGGSLVTGALGSPADIGTAILWTILVYLAAAGGSSAVSSYLDWRAKPLDPAPNWRAARSGDYWAPFW